MALSTEEYLDSLLRQAMGISDPEPPAKPMAEAPEMEREDVFAMADGLTGSNSAILGNAYDHNASFTNRGEIDTSAGANATIADSASAEPAPPNVPVDASMQPDPDSPAPISQEQEPVISGEIPAAVSDQFADIPASTEKLLPDIEDVMPSQSMSGGEDQTGDVPAADDGTVVSSPLDKLVLPDAPVIEHDGSLDIIPHEPAIEPVDTLEINPETIIEENIPIIPEAEMPVMDDAALQELLASTGIGEEPAADMPAVEDIAAEIPAVEDIAAEIPAAEEIAMPEISDSAEMPVMDDAALQELLASTGAGEEPAPEMPAVEELAAEMPAAEDITADIPAAEEIAMPEISDSAEMPVMDDAALQELLASTGAGEEAATEMPAVDDISAEMPAAEEISAEMPADDTSVIDVPPEDEPVIDMTPGEETATEEPSADIPAAEEPVSEESAAEEAGGSDLLDQAAIEALLHGTDLAGEVTDTTEESSAEAEPAASDELASTEDALEELDISLDEEEEAPLMPDQEISELLSTLDGLSGEGSDDSAEDSAEPAAEAGAADAAPGTDLDGIDMFDTDLSAMLDNVTGSLEEETSAQDAGASDDADLGDLLGALDDGSGDLSDIGSLLEKDENSELVDPNTETAEALFASESDEDLFNIDNLIDEEESPKGKKKKKKFSLFGKKKKGGDDIETLGGDEEILIDPALLDIPDEEELKEKKPGFFARLFAKLFEEVEEEEAAEIPIEQSAVEIAQEGAAENEAIMAEMEAGEEGGKKKKKEKKKEKKKKEKEEAAEPGEGEEPAEDKKKKKEKKKKEKVEMPEIPGKKLPRKKVVAIALFCITIGIVITFLAFFFPYSQDMEKARKFYTTGEYQKTYEYMRGHKLTKDDQILYDRTMTLLRIKRPYDSYQNYMKMGLRMEALNALVQGVQMCDRYGEDAASLGIIDKYSKLSRMIYDELFNSFGVTVEKARSWIELEGSPEYTKALYECLMGGSTGGEEDTQQYEGSEEQADSVIDAEENDL